MPFKVLIEIIICTYQYLFDLDLHATTVSFFIMISSFVFGRFVVFGFLSVDVEDCKCTDSCI